MIMFGWLTPRRFPALELTGFPQRLFCTRSRMTDFPPVSVHTLSSASQSVSPTHGIRAGHMKQLNPSWCDPPAGERFIFCSHLPWNDKISHSTKDIHTPSSTRPTTSFGRFERGGFWSFYIIHNYLSNGALRVLWTGAQSHRTRFHFPDRTVKEEYRHGSEFVD